MLKNYIIAIFCLISSFSFSQSLEIKKENIQEVKPMFTTINIVPETMNSYEEQGFKKTMMNEKIVYSKEINGVLIEFTPKEQ